MSTVRNFGVGLLFVTSVTLLTSHAGAGQTLISDFEKGLGSWAFTNGPEFPGAQGALTQATGQGGGWARLTYDLGKGGNYVGAVLATPGINADALSLWLHAPITTKARIRIGDASGQTLQYDLLRTLEGSLDASSWYQVLVDLNAPTTYYGGANDGVPHLPIGSIGVLAVPEIGTSGFLEFDDVNAVAGPLEVTIDSSLPLLPAPDGAATLAPRLAVNLHTTGNSRALDLARDAGFSVVRLDLLWVHSELTPGVYNFQEFDGFVDSLAARGMRLHLILDYTNPLYPDATDPNFSSVTIPAFAALARATAKHFVGKHVSYEIWNEPNSSTFWPQQAGVKLFADLCNAAVNAVHEGDPDALVTTGGTSGIDFDFIQSLATNGGVNSADGIGVHPYRKGGGESVGHDLLLLQNMVSSALSADAPPIWDTEWGYSSTWEGDGHGTNERARQAQLVVRELLSAWAVGFPLIVYYDLNDGGTDPGNSDDNFGLLTPDNSDKPAIVGVRTLSGAAKNRRYAGLLQTASGSVHALRLDGSNDNLLVLWTDDASRSTLVHLPRNAYATDFMGDALTLQPDGTTADLTLNEAAGPVYVTTAPQSNGSGGTGSTGGGSNATGGIGSSSASSPSNATGGTTSGLTLTSGAPGGSSTRGGSNNAKAGSAPGGASNATGGATRGGTQNTNTVSSGGTAGSGEPRRTTTSGGTPQHGSTLENDANTTTAGCSCSTLPKRNSRFAWLWTASCVLLVFLRRDTRSHRRGKFHTCFGGK